MSILKFFFLGSFKVQYAGVDITESLRTRKERAILAYLVMEAQRVHPRETIAEFFWPDRPENQARMNLRQALLGIRKVLTGENTNPFLQINEDTVKFNAAIAWRDTAVFNEHMQATHNHEHPHLHTCPECLSHLEQAVEVYRGDFLEDLLLSDVASFQEWVFFHRERHFRNLLDALHSLAEVYFKQASFDQSYQYAWRYVSLAPLEEEAHRLLMHIFARSGRRSAALQQYNLCRTYIKRELGVEPSAETKRLFEQIKNGLPLDRLETGSLTLAAEPPKSGQARPRPTGPLYDPFTSVPMRPLFMDRLQHTLTRMERDQLMAAVCILAVSFPLNPKMNPELKIQVEQNLVKRLTGSVRKGDTVARLQEDEFAVILEAIKDPLVIPVIAQKILKAVAAPILVQGQTIEVKVALGTSAYPDEGTDANTLVNQADVAMRKSRLAQSAFLFPSS